MSTATASAVSENSRSTAQVYFQGTIATQAFKDDFPKHELKSDYWWVEATQRDLGIGNRRRIVVFKYLADRETLPSGRYTLRPDEPDERFSVIYMELNDAPPPAYTAERGTIEFIHNEQTNHVSGALEVYYVDVGGQEQRMQILFNV
ncbi:hypothetical protein [Pseudomonas yamanorum]|uniref:hypothetical protein n=1 Tax=Pseudomonas yamanorum TaxID=515393 RepID=UPI002ED54024|nr:hypothetical protein VYI69_10275 [Pseudomonas yamanorum]